MLIIGDIINFLKIIKYTLLRIGAFCVILLSNIKSAEKEGYFDF